MTGAVPVTGWALDDVEVANVFVCRSAVAGQGASVDARCGGAAQIFIGNATFVEGARPDVQTAFPNYPWAQRAGWGLMVLTNMLPNQGNGVYVFHMYAMDRDGHALLLGSRTMTCDNANATVPFGTIDTHGQGETVSGSAYLNFGWALTQSSKIIPTDGSTISVYVWCAARHCKLRKLQVRYRGLVPWPPEQQWRRGLPGSGTRRPFRTGSTRSSGMRPTAPE